MNRRILLTGLVVFAIAALLLSMFRGPLSLAIAKRAIARNLTTNLVETLPDGLHLLLCGAGGPLPDPDRSGPCIAVLAGDSLYVVDIGVGGPRNLGMMGFPTGEVDTVLLTHFHSDHIDGLGELGMLRWVGGGHRTPLPVAGPPGVDEIVEGFNRAYRIDARYRTAHHGDKVAPPSGAGLLALPFRQPEGDRAEVVVDHAGLRVIAFAVDHEPVDPAVGYRFDYGGRSLVISGDTSKSDAVLRASQGADLLAHEALGDRLVGLMNEVATAVGAENIAKITSDIPDYHTTPVEAAQIAEEAGARHLLFYHVVPQTPIPGLASVFLDGVGDAYSGDVTLGVDGILVSLPASSDEIEVSRR